MNDPVRSGLQDSTWDDAVKIVHHLYDDCHLLEVDDTVIVNIIKFERPFEFCLRYGKYKVTIFLFNLSLGYFEIKNSICRYFTCLTV